MVAPLAQAQSAGTSLGRDSAGQQLNDVRKFLPVQSSKPTDRYNAPTTDRMAMISGSSGANQPAVAEVALFRWLVLHKAP